MSTFPQTIKLYDDNPEQTTFIATVLACEEVTVDGKKAYRVLLNQTAFFPEEGGQTADKGTLEGIEVADVQIKENFIFHYLPAPLTEGATVSGCIDWNHRFDFMQQHTAEHIFSGLVYALYGLKNVGFHLSEREVTMDFNAVLSEEQLRDLELRVNEAIYLDIPVKASFPAKEVLDAMNYRSKIALEGPIRIVEIPGYDTCACCAPHVKSTGQIGIMKIIHTQNYKGGIRIHIACGKRALMDYRKKHDTVSAIAVSFSTKPSLVGEAVRHLEEEISLQKNAYHSLQAKYLEILCDALPAPEVNENAVLFVEDMDSVAVRKAVNTLCESYPGYSVIFNRTGERYTFIAGSKSKDCNTLTALLRTRFGAKCGGNAVMIQGSVEASESELSACLTDL